MAVVRDLLADPLRPQRKNIQDSRLPRRTYQTCLRRIYLRGWLRDRFVPSASLRPGSVALLVLARRDGSGPVRPAAPVGGACVQAWAGSRSVFALYLFADVETAEAARTGPLSERNLTDVRSLLVDPHEDGLPVYFDFEGEWAQYGGLSGTARYPQAFPRGPSGTDDASVPERRREAAQRLVQGPLAPPSYRPRPRNGLAGWADRAAATRLVRHGSVSARSFLDPVSVARDLSDFAGALIWLVGDLREGVGARAFRSALLDEAGLRPFLFASDERSAVVGFLGRAPWSRSGLASRGRFTAREVVDRCLVGPVVRTMVLDGLATPVDHRYDRYLALGDEPSTGPRPGAKG